MRRSQLRLWHLMSIVAITALLIVGFVWLHSLVQWLNPLTPPSTSSNALFYKSSYWFNVAGYEIPHTSPLFWVITGILLAVALGMVALLVVAMVRAIRALGRRHVTKA